MAAAEPTADGPPAIPDDAVEVGRVMGAWGVKGALRIKPFSADPQALFSSKRWFLRHAENAGPPRARPQAAPPSLLRVIQAREQGDAIVATAHDIADRDAAQALAGASVFVARSSFPTPAQDEFYWVDLIGLQVQNREGLALGTVVGLVETGPTCVLRIEPAKPAPPADGGETAEVMIPFVSAYVDEVDLPGRRLRVDWQPDF